MYHDSNVPSTLTGKPRDWLAYYQWQVIEQDSVFSVVAQDDLLFATNHRSHVAGVRYRALKGLEAHLWGLVSKPDVDMNGSDQYQWRLRLDINTKF